VDTDPWVFASIGRTLISNINIGLDLDFKAKKIDMRQQLFFFGTKKRAESKKKKTKRLIEHCEACKYQKCHQKGDVEALLKESQSYVNQRCPKID